MFQNRFHWLLASLVLTALVPACGGLPHAGGPAEVQEAGTPAGTAEAPAPALPAGSGALTVQRAAPGAGAGDEYVRRPYKIGPGDHLRIDTWNADEVFNQEHTVGPDGAITLPLYGVLDVRGKTRTELAETLAGILGEDYRDPRVTITVLEYKNANFYVFGEVGRPGAHAFEGGPYLLEAINLAGGLTDTADLANCSVVRGNNNVVKVDLVRLFRGGDRSLNVEIGVGDVVYVPRNSERVIHVLGEVGRPGIIPVPYGEEISLVSAILLAGSYTKDAALGSVYVVRGDPAHPQFIAVSLKDVLAGKGGNIALVPGDIVYVSQRTLAKVNYFISQLTPALSSVFFADQFSRAVENFGTSGGSGQ